MTAKNFGYIRVSTTAQTLDRQTDALTNAGIHPDDIYADKISGIRQNRPGLDNLLSRVRDGDTITVVSLDRLGRSAIHIMQTIAELTERNIHVQSLKPGEDMGGPTGQLLRGIMILVAEWERQMMLERVAESRAARAARAKAGEQIEGRPRTALTHDKIRKVRALREGNRSVAEIMKLTGMSRTSVYRAIHEAGTH
jgi:DNA invertase Pin-like site-specific DNA recombinase